MINTDSLIRKLYAQDASMYQELPKGAAFPKNRDEVAELVRKAYKESFTITPRGAGTSLAGQATGSGVIMDLSRHMNQVLAIEPKERTALVEPGVIRDSLNQRAARYNLHFGPDTSTTNRCVIGGMIGNNSSGSFSIRYQTTREHVKEMEVVLSNGEVAHIKPLRQSELDAKLKEHSLEGHIYRSMIRLLMRNKKLITESYPHPEILRRNTGYALDKLCAMQPISPNGKPFNLCELLCGSEGTLAITTRALLNLEEKPKYQRLVIPQFNSINEAMYAAVEAVRLKPSAVELVDDIILNATKGNIEHVQNRFFLEGEPKCILIIQFEGNTKPELEEKAADLINRLKDKGLGYAHPELEDPALMNRVWELRKAGLGLLMGLGKDARSPTFCEDTAVRVEDLPAYVEEFQQILKKHETDCVFYAHASVGELHFRPVIDITKTEGINKMKAMAEEVAELVARYRGSLSGEHGDGRARSPYLEKVLGTEMMPILQQVKEIWDPHYLLNPGKIVNPKPIEADLRFSPDYAPLNNLETTFNWRREGSLTEAAELCNGAGVCRKLAESGGTMCPSYMATGEEKDTTRGRANVFRQVFSGVNPDGFKSEELKDALELCLSCKACKSECPANVDMARMKAEFLNGWHKEYGVSLRERFFGSPARLYSLASRFAGLTNVFCRSWAGKEVLSQLVGISKERSLPEFRKETFLKWFNKHPRTPEGDKVVLFIDLFTNHHEPETGMEAVKVLESGGYEVLVPELLETGRPQISKGLLTEAKRICQRMINELYPYIEQGIPIIGLEPSEILTLRDEYLDLCEDPDLPKANKIAEATFTIEEFLLRNKERFSFSETPPSQQLLLHGHCHAKALIGNNAIAELLKLSGYDIEILDSGCCGMAGSFGYEKEHYSLSMKIGNQRLFPSIMNRKKAEVCAPGFSCRHQIKQGTGRQAVHPISLIARRLNL